VSGCGPGTQTEVILNDMLHPGRGDMNFYRHGTKKDMIDTFLFIFVILYVNF
jgi:hypothetical protein